jgi:hypothetical protein
MTCGDRTVIARFDVSDSERVCERYHMTAANTVIHESVCTGEVREKGFPDAVKALAFCIEQTGWANVVDELLDYSADTAIRDTAKLPAITVDFNGVDPLNRVIALQPSGMTLWAGERVIADDGEGTRVPACVDALYESWVILQLNPREA